MGPKEPNRKQGEETKRSRWGFRGMTVRDWLELLIVPLVLVGIGLLFENQQANRQQAMEAQQRALEEQRAEAEREIAEQRAQDEALQAYLDEMNSLLLDKNLRGSAEDSEVRTLARARTVTIIRRLDSARNRDVLQFLREARLTPSPSLGNPNLGTLGGSKVSIVRLDYTNLSEANLRGANLDSFDLRRTDLSGADLRGAYLAWSILLETDLKGADWRGANLSGEVDLSGANLEDANLEGAEGITEVELEQQAESLEGATMPNGQKYEDWLKSNGSGEDEENPDPS